jgi:hypothetical protein
MEKGAFLLFAGPLAMPENEKEHYDIEPGAAHDDALRAELEPRLRPQPPEEDAPLPTGDVHDLDVCPNCGASMRGTDELVCLRCGFDLKTMKTIETRVGEAGVDEEDEELEERAPLSIPGRGDLWLPGAVAGVSILVLIIAYAGGVGMLFDGAETPNFGDRLVAVLRFLVRLSVWGGSALAALWVTARIINQQPLGEISVAAVRVLAAVAVINLVRFIGLEHDAWEKGIELVLQAGLFPLMLLALFGMPLRDAAATAIITIGTLLAMVLAPLIVSWSM